MQCFAPIFHDTARAKRECITHVACHNIDPIARPAIRNAIRTEETRFNSQPNWPAAEQAAYIPVIGEDVTSLFRSPNKYYQYLA
jgi:hypothetical protein